jgi:general nucleoside transport system permease protein
MPEAKRWQPPAPLLVAGLLLVAVALLLLVGRHLSPALLALHAGSVGTRAGLTDSLIKATPLLFTGLSAAVAFRCGVWNIGAEGQFLVGMLASTAAALALPPLPPLVGVPLCLLAGATAGALWAALPAFLRVKRQVPEVITTIMLNFGAVYLVEYLVRGPLRDPRSASEWSPLIPEATFLPRIQTLTGVSATGIDAVRLPSGAPLVAGGLEVGRMHLGVFLALLAPVVVWLWVTRTRSGFALRPVGENPAAASAAGLPVGRAMLVSFLISGALAGLGGGVELLGQIQRMYRFEAGSPGYGFTGIPVALLAGLHPLGVGIAAFFFGALSAGCSQMQRTAGISFQVAYVIQAVVVLGLLCLPGVRRRLPPGVARWQWRPRGDTRRQPAAEDAPPA